MFGERMTSWVLVFLFTFHDGRQVEARQDAVALEEYRPVRTLRGCQQVADIREQRMNAEFVRHPGLVQAVTIHCRKAKPVKRHKSRRAK